MSGITASFHSAVIPRGDPCKATTNHASRGIFVFIRSLSKRALNGSPENKNPPPYGEGFVVALRREGDYLSMIPGSESFKPILSTLSGFFLLAHHLLNASITRLFTKRKNPSLRDLTRLVWRREGDSNPRYPFEVHALSRRAS